MRGGTDLQKLCLNQKELARRWGISHRTLERWRSEGRGPAYLKLGGRVLYRLPDIEAFEHSQLHRALTISNAVAGAAQFLRLTGDPSRAARSTAVSPQKRRVC
jgi:hypothetical protein